MRPIRIGIICCLVLGNVHLLQAGKLVYTDPSDKIYVGPYVELMTDTSGQLDWETQRNEVSYKACSTPIIPLGISGFSHWLRFSIENQTDDPNMYLEVDFPVLDELDVYVESPGGSYTVLTGEARGLSTKPVRYNSFGFPITVNTGQTATVYLRIRSSEQINLPISVSSNKGFWDSVIRDKLFFGVYLGLIGVMFFYNLFIYFTTRDRSYLIYISYILFVGFVQFSLEGYASTYLWPEVPRLSMLSLNIFNALTAFASIAFFRSFVKLPALLPRANKLLLGIGALYIVELILAFAGLDEISYNLMNLAATILAIALFVISILAIRKGSRPAQFFLTGWSFFLGSIIVFVLKDVGVVPYNIFTSNILQFGSGMEVVLLSFGLADRINVLKREKEQSQQAALEALQEKERLVSQQNEMLERKVKERTTELEQSNTNLNTALNELKSAQTQLVEQEKMASLGQLTAGIAHEINNPINFVTANVKPLQRDLEDILEVFDAYEAIEDEADFANKKGRIESLKAELEVDYLREEIQSLLKGIDDGAHRTADIVRGLKVFSRTDEQDLKRVDLAEGIDSTLTLLNNSMKGKMELIKEYDDVPKIECYAGKMNQVFMNILSNAVYAISEEEDSNKVGEIRVSLKDIGDQVEIIFSDNGSGMPEDVRSRIFEPFYTTKPVGDGTGLGLSISKSIIDKHNGSIKVTSEKGVGTTFHILLPKIQES